MTEFTKRIVAGANDGYSNGGFNNNAAYARPGAALGSVPMDAFLRFTNITIPQGATIIPPTFLTLRAQASRSTTAVNLKISMCDADNPAAPTDRASHVALARTTANALWNNVGAWVAGSDYDSPDITDAVQEVIDRGGWASGQAMIALLDDNGSDNGAYRDILTYNSDINNCALLTITYAVDVTITPGPSSLGMGIAGPYFNRPTPSGISMAALGPTVDLRFPRPILMGADKRGLVFGEDKRELDMGEEKRWIIFPEEE